ncbi:hypothetical protein BJ742DRAFT_830614 [Cladochytrium replicatum]|nr:hypothetical protein BJ742DRAFT_830614 [Cladochytrium replicatum]
MVESQGSLLNVSRFGPDRSSSAEYHANRPTALHSPPSKLHVSNFLESKTSNEAPHDIVGGSLARNDAIVLDSVTTAILSLLVGLSLYTVLASPRKGLYGCVGRGRFGLRTRRMPSWPYFLNIVQCLLILVKTFVALLLAVVPIGQIEASQCKASSILDGIFLLFAQDAMYVILLFKVLVFTPIRLQLVAKWWTGVGLFAHAVGSISALAIKSEVRFSDLGKCRIAVDFLINCIQFTIELALQAGLFGLLVHGLTRAINRMDDEQRRNEYTPLTLSTSTETMSKPNVRLIPCSLEAGSTVPSRSSFSHRRLCCGRQRESGAAKSTGQLRMTELLKKMRKDENIHIFFAIFVTLLKIGFAFFPGVVWYVGAWVNHTLDSIRSFVVFWVITRDFERSFRLSQAPKTKPPDFTRDPISVRPFEGGNTPSPPTATDLQTGADSSSCTQRAPIDREYDGGETDPHDQENSNQHYTTPNVVDVWKVPKRR